MSKEGKFVILLAILALAIGVIWELSFGSCTNAIARSGSVIVAIAIYFGIPDIAVTNMLNNFEQLSVLKKELIRLDKQSLQNDIVFSDEEIESKIKGSTPYLKDRAIAIYRANNKGVVRIDIFVGIFGTLLWGFGDLISGIIFKCT